MPEEVVAILEEMPGFFRNIWYFFCISSYLYEESHFSVKCKNEENRAQVTEVSSQRSSEE